MGSEFSGPDSVAEFSGQEFPGYRRYPYEDEDGVIWIDQVGLYERNASYCMNCGCTTHRYDVVYNRFFCNSVSCYYEVEAMKLDKQLTQREITGGRHKRN